MFRNLPKFSVAKLLKYNLACSRNVTHTLDCQSAFPVILRKGIIQAWRPMFGSVQSPPAKYVEKHDESYYEKLLSKLGLNVPSKTVVVNSTLNILNKYAKRVESNEARPRKRVPLSFNTAGKIRKFVGDRNFFGTSATLNSDCKTEDPCGGGKSRKGGKKKGGGKCNLIKAECLGGGKGGGGSKRQSCKKMSASACGQQKGKKNDCSKAVPCGGGGGKKGGKKDKMCAKAIPCGKAGKKKSDPCGGGERKDPCAGGGKKKQSPCGSGKKKNPCGGGKEKDPCAGLSGGDKKKQSCGSAKKSACGSAKKKSSCGSAKKSSCGSDKKKSACGKSSKTIKCGGGKKGGKGGGKPICKSPDNTCKKSFSTSAVLDKRRKKGSCEDLYNRTAGLEEKARLAREKQKEQGGGGGGGKGGRGGRGGKGRSDSNIGKGRSSKNPKKK